MCIISNAHVPEKEREPALSRQIKREIETYSAIMSFPSAAAAAAASPQNITCTFLFGARNQISFVCCCCIVAVQRAAAAAAAAVSQSVRHLN
jgi:hypothetical protein